MTLRDCNIVECGREDIAEIKLDYLRVSGVL